jgi:hypothetical protein
MFLTHLNCFISFIAVLLFFIRIKQKSFSEIILISFSVLIFISYALWLYQNFYGPRMPFFFDYFGVITENFLSVLPIFYIVFLGKKISKSTKLFSVIIVVIFSIALFLLHFSISSGSNLIFYPLNKNMNYNVLIQIVIDLILFALFLIVFFNKNLVIKDELFDGNFKIFILIAFSFYYLQDILVLLLMYLAFIKVVVVHEIIFYFALFFNLITTLFIMIAAIYTNWLREINAVRLVKSLDNPNEINPVLISLEELRAIKYLDWNIIKSIYLSKYNELITSIEANQYLSKTEKMYAFFDNFQLSNKFLSDALCVSVRTIETNFYRTRKKLNNE